MEAFGPEPCKSGSPINLLSSSIDTSYKLDLCYLMCTWSGEKHHGNPFLFVTTSVDLLFIITTQEHNTLSLCHMETINPPGRISHESYNNYNEDYKSNLKKIYTEEYPQYLIT
jgi:hypothetical protein